jgi:hypothetical protein
MALDPLEGDGMTTALRLAVVEAAAARLAAAIPTVTVEKHRRSDPNLDECPLLVVRMDGGEMSADVTQSPGETAWAVDFTVAGYVTATDDEALAVAIASLEAETIAALEGESLPGGAGGDLTTGVEAIGSILDSFSADEAEEPASSFVATFRATVFAPTASPFAA